MDIQAWHLWTLAAIAAGTLEMMLPGFVVLWFGVGALGAALAAALGVGTSGQFALFSVVSLGLFASSRTIFKKAFMRDASPMKTGVPAMLGQEAVVVEALAEGAGGTVRINGELWSARPLGGDVAEGERVIVEQVEGLKLWVRHAAVTRELIPSHKKEGF